jgi:hypothetical protein
MATLRDIKENRWWAMARNNAKTANLTSEEKATLNNAAAAEALSTALELMEGDAPDDDSLESELRDIQNGKVRVSRKSNKQGSPGGYLFTIGSDEMSLDDLMDKIRREYGGGEYRLRVTRSNGAFAINRDVSIAEPLTPAVQAAPPAAPASDDRLASILISMQENNRLLMDSMRQQQLAQAESMQTVFVEIIRAQAQREPAPAAAQQSPTDLLAMMGMFKELFGSEKHADPMKVFLQGVDFAKKMSGGDGDDNPVMEMFKTLAPPLLAFAQQQGAPMQRPPMGMPRQALPPQPMMQQAPQVVDTNMRSNIQSDGGVGEMTELSGDGNGVSAAGDGNSVSAADSEQLLELARQMAPYINVLTTAATIDADPETYANMVLDMVPPEQVLAIVGDDKRYGDLLAQIPGIEELREWFDALRSCLVELLKEEQQIDDGGNDVPGGAGPQDISDAPLGNLPAD